MIRITKRTINHHGSTYYHAITTKQKEKRKKEKNPKMTLTFVSLENISFMGTLVVNRKHCVSQACWILRRSLDRRIERRCFGRMCKKISASRTIRQMVKQEVVRLKLRLTCLLFFSFRPLVIRKQ